MFEVQAIRYGRAFALQFHPDVTHAMMHRWTTRGHERMALPGAKPRDGAFRRPRGLRLQRAGLAQRVSGALARELSRGGTLAPSLLLLTLRELLGEIGHRLGVDLRRVPLQQHLEIGGAFAPRLAALPAVAFADNWRSRPARRARCE